MNGDHGRPATYHAGCRCWQCRRAHRLYNRGTPDVVTPADCAIDHDWALLNFPVAVVARGAFPDDAAAIAEAFPSNDSNPNQLELELDE